MIKTIVVFLCLAVIFVSPYYASAEDKDTAKLFTDKNISGVIVLINLDESKTFISNEKRALTPFVPASTFKIPNTLIALDKGIVTEKDVIKWNGKNSGVEAWNRDQTLETAFKSSCIWFYQELARRIGTSGYESYFKKLNYGNGSPTPALTTFWLEGDLKISAIDQIKFLKNVYLKAFPFRSDTYETLKKIMVIEKTSNYTLRAKTGWGQRITPQIGWYVGYVETKNQAWFFATNIEVTKPEDLPLRQQLTMEALKIKGII